MGIIFISHSSEDNTQAMKVRDWLIDNGWSQSQIFVDLTDFASGDNWRKRLNEVGKDCEAVIACLSDNWVRSAECLREFNHAESLGKPIFPILVSPLTEPLPNFVASVQFADISDPVLATNGFSKLKLGLTRARIGPKHFLWPPEGEPDRSPYRGLQALTEKDAAVFFGRDGQITEGLDTLRQMRDGNLPRILTITAASGAGKSSFLKAGLLSRLTRDEENFLVLPTLRPGRDALNGEAGLLRSLSMDAMAQPEVNLKSHLDNLQTPIVQRLTEINAAAGEIYDRPPPALVLPIDQAEELFSADNVSGKEALALVARCIGGKSDLLVALTIRSDSLGSLQADAQLAPMIKLMSLPVLPPEAFKEIIEGPAAINKPKPIEIEPALTSALIGELNRADALPLLAFTLERLVEGYADDYLLELHEYTEGLGGIEGAINAAVEAAFRRVEQDPDIADRSRFALDKLARAAFIPSLVQLTEADASPKRRVTKLSNLPQETHPLIRHFVDERLLVSSVQHGETMIEVSHEAVLRHWRGLAAWIGEERVVLEGLSRIQRSAKEWGGNEKTLSAHSPDLLVHRGERLLAAEAYLERADLARELEGAPTAYLKACREREDDEVLEAVAIEERDRERLEQQRRLQRIIWGVMAIAIGLVGFGGWTVIDGRRVLHISQSLSLSRAVQQANDAQFESSAQRLSILAARPDWGTMAASDGAASLVDTAQRTFTQNTMWHQDEVNGALFSSDESRILTWSRDGTARLWDAASGAQIGPSLQHEGNVYGAVFSADESRILTWSRDYTVRVWDSQSGMQIGSPMRHVSVKGATFSKDEARIFTWGGRRTRLWDTLTTTQIDPGLWHERAVSGAVFSADGNRVLTWNDDRTASVWGTQSNAQIGSSLQHKDIVNGAVLSADENRILTWSDDNTARLWDAESGRQLGPSLQHKGNVRGAVFSADENRILTWGGDATARLWDAKSGTQLGLSLRHDGGIVDGAVFSTDESRILTWGRDDTARLWDAQTGGQIGLSMRHDSFVKGGVFSSTEEQVLTWGWDNKVRLWDAATGGQIGPSLSHGGRVKGAIFSKDGTSILTWDEVGRVRLWDASRLTLAGSLFDDDDEFQSSSGEPILLTNRANGESWIRVIKNDEQVGRDLQYEEIPNSADFSADTTQVLTTADDGTARIWDVQSGEQLGPSLRHGGKVKGGSFFSGGSRILTWGDDSMVRFWDTESRSEITPSLAHDFAVFHAEFYADETRILTWGYDKVMRFWDAETRVQVGSGLQHGDWIDGAVFSADESRILTWSRDKIARLWDIEDGIQISSDLQHTGEIYGAEFSSDGKRLLIWSGERTGRARIWDVASGRQLGPSFHHMGGVRMAMFSADETRILTWSDDGTVRQWDVTWAMDPAPSLEYAQKVCATKLNGNVWEETLPDGTMVKRSPRHINEADIELAPILEGRLGEDVCAYEEPWWYPVTRAIVSWLPE